MGSMKNLYVSVTTIKDWRPRIEEVNKLGLTEIALFLSAADAEQRKQIYTSLKQTPVKSIPCVHARSDMERWEYEFLVSHYGSGFFNLHPSSEARDFIEKNSDLCDRIYIENLDKLDQAFFELVDLVAGVCLDISHWQDFGILQNRQGYESFDKYLHDHKVGWAHISAINDKLGNNISATDGKDIIEYNLHTLTDMHQMDYLAGIKEFLPSIAAIELNNSLTEQIQIRDYIFELLK